MIQRKYVSILGIKVVSGVNFGSSIDDNLLRIESSHERRKRAKHKAQSPRSPLTPRGSQPLCRSWCWMLSPCLQPRGLQEDRQAATFSHLINQYTDSISDLIGSKKVKKKYDESTTTNESCTRENFMKLSGGTWQQEMLRNLQLLFVGDLLSWKWMCTS